MRTSVLCLASALALCLVLPYCRARPGSEVYVKKGSSQQASASSSDEQESNEQFVKKSGCGCGGGASVIASKKKSSKAVAASSSSSSSSYEAKKIDSGCGCKTLTEAQIKEKYAKKSCESWDDYFKRIVAKDYPWTSTTEAYIKTLTLVWKDFRSLELWYNKKYFSFIKDFYLAYYAKKSSESWDEYYTRLTKKEAWETDDIFGKRITIIRDCFPTLDLWVNPSWLKWIKPLYALEFKRWEGECEADWVKRIFEKDPFFDTTDELWTKKLFLIQESTISSCSLWYKKDYFSYFKKFYEIYYKKQEKETCDGWLARALTLLPGESLDQAITRITFIKEVTGDCGCWKSEYFKKVQQAKCLDQDWLVRVQKAFFPCGCGAVSVQRSSSKKSVSASSSSADSSSEYSKIVKSG